MKHGGQEKGCGEKITSFQGFKMPHKKVEGSHPHEHQERIGTAVLGKTNVISHESQREGAWDGNRRGE
jgi:hypothetical protein